MGTEFHVAFGASMRSIGQSALISERLLHALSRAARLLVQWQAT